MRLWNYCISSGSGSAESCSLVGIGQPTLMSLPFESTDLSFIDASLKYVELGFSGWTLFYLRFILPMVFTTYQTLSYMISQYLLFHKPHSFIIAFTFFFPYLRDASRIISSNSGVKTSFDSEICSSSFDFSLVELESLPPLNKTLLMAENPRSIPLSTHFKIKSVYSFSFSSSEL